MPTRGRIIQLVVYSDVICPWCYIGKRRLDRALAMSPGPGGAGLIEVQWRPFLLNPGMAPAGMDRKAYLAWKFGGADRVSLMSDRIAQEGRQDGILFAFDRIARTPNSTDAHRAILFAQSHGSASVMVEALFAAYFSAARDIGARDELVAIGGECGLDADRLRDYLQSDAGHSEVTESNERAHALGINAVPCFVFDGREALAGAQPPEVFLRLFAFARRKLDIAVS